MNKLLLLITLALPLNAIASPVNMQGESTDNHMSENKQQPGMMNVNDRMKKMIKLMEKLHTSRDFNERDEMIAEHIDDMNNGIKEMRSMGGKTMRDLHRHNMKRKKPVNKKGLVERINNLERRIDILQIMLEQVIDSRQAERAQRHGHL